VNQFDPLGDTTVATVRLDDVIGNRIVKGMKIDVEGFEMEVLKGCSSALGAGRISLLQLEWNEASKVATGTDRAPLADFLGEFGYHLYHPSQIGELLPLDNVPSYGADVFAKRP
jgi:hypothetical protein